MKDDKLLEDKRIIIICKRDYLVRFWKISLEKDQEYPNEEVIYRILEFLQRRGAEYKLNDPRGYYEVWETDQYKSIDYTDILNVDGLNWPRNFKDVSLFPEANIKTEKDLARYNKWRVSTFRSYITQLRNSYVWKRDDGIIPALKYKTNWTDIDESFIVELNPPELFEGLPRQVRLFLTNKLKSK